eukprot:TRINITY_DN24214_c0_g1_i1.p2 TRINITY_DN24214_c0_g1~~TRINITY_DN24214_c0_g1_i1.p2  ORF type:complete len:100 (+),score=15.98 TRINITY_DN24214_c0_g1_i1:134-433(+)
MAQSGPILNPATAPIKVELKEGETAWICRCGQSKKFPYCDGTHTAYNKANGTDFSPYKLEAKDGQNTFYICACGQSKKREAGEPFCDGSHTKIVDVKNN